MRGNVISACSRVVLPAVTCALLAAAAPAVGQSYTVLHEFGPPPATSDGSGPLGLIRGTDGDFYGMTSAGGTNGHGTVFQITPMGTLTTIYSFSELGPFPYGALVQGTDGSLYGATAQGGSRGAGTIFRISLAGELTTLHSFVRTDGWRPQGGLVQGTDGNFYGTTQIGGPTAEIEITYGLVFGITPDGDLTTLHVFAGGDGQEPHAGLTQGTDGNFYGTTMWGGMIGPGTAFMITPSGTLTTLHSFGVTEMFPRTGLVLGADGDFYGTTVGPGLPDYNTIFKITPTGVLTTLYSFLPLTKESYSNLVGGSDGNIYGIGGLNTPDQGAIFKMTPTGALSTYYSFSGSDGSGPSGLVQGTDGNLYGTTAAGGSFGAGVIFRLTPPPPTAAVSGGGTICVGGSATIQAALTGTPPWSLSWSDGVIQSGVMASTATRTVSPTSTTTYTLTSLSDAYGPGTSSGSGVVTVQKPPKAAVSGDTTICAGASTVIQADLKGTPPWSLTWSDGFTQTVSASPATRTVSPSDHTIYTITSVSDAACSGTSSGNANVKVKPIPSAVIVAATSVCASSTGNVASVPGAGDDAVYTWSITNGAITSDQGTKKIRFTAGSSGAVSLSVTVTSSAGCTSASSLTVPITAVPDGTISAPTSVCKKTSGYSASVMDAGPGATYDWKVSHGTITAGAGTRAITFSSGGDGAVTIKVTITNAAGCTTVSSVGLPLVPGC